MQAIQVWEVQIQIKIVSVANLREHWAKRAARAKLHRHSAAMTLKVEAGKPEIAKHYRVTITRRGGRTLDSDNLSSGAKACRDGVSDWLGIDDGSALIEWRYAQASAPRGRFWVDVKVERMAEA